jgi:mono/diheme cytochrome c family protein
MDSSENQIKQNILERMDRCSVCHRGFAADDLKVIRRERGFWVVAVTCSDCHNRNLVAAVLNDGDTAEARSALRELSRSAGYGISFDDESALPIDEASITEALGDPVTADDVLEMHEYLNEFDGDFKGLFAGNTDPS